MNQYLSRQLSHFDENKKVELYLTMQQNLMEEKKKMLAHQHLQK